MAEDQLPSYSHIKLEREGDLTWLTFNRPERLNAMNALMTEEIGEALDVLAKHKPTRVIIIRGGGRAFSAGYDLQRDQKSIAEEHDIVDDFDRLNANMNRFLKIWDHPKPVIAAVHGYCLAGATQLCVFCDITVVAEDAIIGLPAIPAGGGYITPLWTPLVGPKRAKQMAFVANSRISGTMASEWGWANYAVPAAELEANVRKLGNDIAKIPAKILHMKKVAINRAWDIMGFRNIVPMGAETDALLHYSDDVKQLSGAIREHGLKEAIAKFAAGEIFKE
jgi:enoyl-CoA hydratase/carnithine racemase